MRLGKKLKAGLKLGAKIGAGVIGAAGVVGAGLFALGSKASPSPSESTASQDFMSGTGSIANVSTADLDKLYPRLPQVESGAQIGTDSQGNFSTSIPSVISRAQPRQESTASIIRRRVNDVPPGFIPPPTGNQNFVGGAINPLWN